LALRGVSAQIALDSSSLSLFFFSVHSSLLILLFFSFFFCNFTGVFPLPPPLPRTHERTLFAASSSIDSLHDAAVALPVQFLFRYLPVPYVPSCEHRYNRSFVSVKIPPILRPLSFVFQTSYLKCSFYYKFYSSSFPSTRRGPFLSR